MLRKSYLERQIEGLALVLAKLLRLKNEDSASALAEIHAGCKKLTGLDLDALRSLPDQTVIALLTTGDGFDASNCIVTATLLDERAEIEDAQGRPDDARVSRRKALVLFVEALLHEERLRSEAYRVRTDALIAQLSGQPLSTSLLHRLFRYHEATENYAKAEDALFALRESGYSGSRDIAAAFYQRLRALPDDALAAGGLPRDEVEEEMAVGERAG